MTTLCDVIDNCTECPRYGDDCDGSAERLYTHEEAWGMCDYISRADAKMTEEVREALMRLAMCAKEECDMCKYKDECGFDFQYNISTENMNTILDALSAEAEWIPFKKRPLTDEEKQEYPDWTYIFDCPLPNDEEEILLSNGKYVWTDTFINDGECYLDGGDDIDDGMAWMPLPKPYREDGE